MMNESRGDALAFRFAGVALIADPSGALWRPDRRCLIVADLHFEKGAAMARRGAALPPPWDSAATADKLAAVVARYAPETVICLGDSFHDTVAAAAPPEALMRRLEAAARGRDWIWVAGNHDPAPPGGGIGRCVEAHRDAPLIFRHEAAAGATAGEITGHFHPKIALRLRGTTVRGRCFALGARRLILPAFGAYTGGLDVRDPAIARLFSGDLEPLVIGRRGVYRASLRPRRPPAGTPTSGDPQLRVG